MLNDAISLMVLTYLHNEPTVGTVGARLHYASGQIQHLGIKYSRQPNELLLSHYMAGQDFQRSHHPEGLHLIKSYGNTAVFMLMSRQIFLMLAGYNENYHQCFEDAELNLKLLAMGKQNLLPIDAVCYHFESQTRRDNEKQNFVDYQDFQRIKHFLALHHHQIEYFLQSKS